LDQFQYIIFLSWEQSLSADSLGFILNLAGDSLNELFGESVMTTSYSGSRIDIGDGLRVPDFLSKRCFANVDRRAAFNGGPAVMYRRGPAAMGADIP
jgi:hypothetical protein